MTSAINSVNPDPLVSGNLPSVSTEPLKTAAPKENPKTIPKEELKGKTVFEAITMQAKADGAIRAGDTPSISKLVGHFPKEGDNVVADYYMEGDKKFFKFDVTWKATVNDKDVEFTQVIYTSIEIPTDGLKLKGASNQAYEVAKSYELLQRNLTEKLITSDIKAIRQNALVSFEKTTPNLNLDNYKVSYIPKTSSGNLDVGLLKLDKRPKINLDKKIGLVFASRLQKMQGLNVILLAEGSGSVKAECDRKDAGLPAKVDANVYKAHVDGQLKEVKKQNKAALAPVKVANADAIEVKQLRNELDGLLNERQGDLALLEEKRQEIENKFDAIPEIKELQEVKKRSGELLIVLENQLNSREVSDKNKKELEPEIASLEKQIQEIEEKIISMKKAILEDPIIEEEGEGERFELKVEEEAEFGNKSVVIDFEDLESSDTELLESEEESRDISDIFRDGVELGKYSPMPNDDQSNNKELK